MWLKKRLNEGNQIHNFISSSGSGNGINYGQGSGSGSTSQKVTVPTVPVPQRCLVGRSPLITWPQGQDRSLRNRCRWAARGAAARPAHTRTTGSLSAAEENFPQAGQFTRHSSRGQNRSVRLCLNGESSTKHWAPDWTVLRNICTRSPTVCGRSTRVAAARLAVGWDRVKQEAGACVMRSGARGRILSSPSTRYWVKKARSRHVPWSVQIFCGSAVVVGRGRRRLGSGVWANSCSTASTWHSCNRKICVNGQYCISTHLHLTFAIGICTVITKFRINPEAMSVKIKIKQEKLSGKRFLSSHVYWHSAKHYLILNWFFLRPFFTYQ